MGDAKLELSAIKLAKGCLSNCFSTCFACPRATSIMTTVSPRSRWSSKTSLKYPSNEAQAREVNTLADTNIATHKATNTNVFSITNAVARPILVESMTVIKAAKKFEGKNNLKKAKKRYEKAQKLLIQSNKKFPNKANTLNYLGFTTRKLGDFENGEKYYLQGLAIEPNHVGINEYLGELYVATNRHNLAVERLEILESCNCKEYNQLKAVIAGEKVSKY